MRAFVQSDARIRSASPGVLSFARQDTTRPCYFPGAAGLHFPRGATEHPPFPIGGVMVLGHNWGVMNDWHNTANDGQMQTWRNLLATLRRGKIDPAICFFTNFFLHLMEGDDNMAPFPGGNEMGMLNGASACSSSRWRCSARVFCWCWEPKCRRCWLPYRRICVVGRASRATEKWMKAG